MKKIIVYLMCLLVTPAYAANFCPEAVNLLKMENGRIILTIPPEWHLLVDPNLQTSDIDFNTAQWGNHETESARVRCFYFSKDKKSYIYLESNQLIHRSVILSHSEWKKVYRNDPYYYLCGDYNRYYDPKACPFY